MPSNQRGHLRHTAGDLSVPDPRVLLKLACGEVERNTSMAERTPRPRVDVSASDDHTRAVRSVNVADILTPRHIAGRRLFRHG